MKKPNESSHEVDGFTALELVLFLINFAVASYIALLGLRRYGWIGFVAGFVLGFILLPTCILAMVWLRVMIFTGKPSLPKCGNQRCEARDYRVIRGTKDGFLYECKCGIRYMKEGRQTYEVLPNGEDAAYMEWRAFKGWFPIEKGKVK